MIFNFITYFLITDTYRHLQWPFGSTNSLYIPLYKIDHMRKPFRAVVFYLNVQFYEGIIFFIK